MKSDGTVRNVRNRFRYKSVRRGDVVVVIIIIITVDVRRCVYGMCALRVMFYTYYVLCAYARVYKSSPAKYQIPDGGRTRRIRILRAGGRDGVAAQTKQKLEKRDRNPK